MTSGRVRVSNDEDFDSTRIEEIVEEKQVSTNRDTVVEVALGREVPESKNGFCSGPLDTLKAVTISDETGVYNLASVL
ncbi:unnamed protein product [Echinostoma caproni]|uniref:Uncharacterized protein n=1 Tax=Echinostoma caproni TaxID=27848 RepID=A0A183B772_9TREM|nr:unnamed protein product [Echinostoma caproni]